MEKGSFLAQLAEVLQQDIDLSQDFNQHLITQRSIIEKKEIDQISMNVEAQHILLEAIFKVHTACNQLAEVAKQQFNIPQLSFSALEPILLDNQLLQFQKIFDDLQSIHEEVKKNIEINSKLVQGANKEVTRVLNLMFGKTEEATLYNANANTYQTNGSTSLTKA